MMRKLLLLGLCGILVPLASGQEAKFEKWEKEIATFEEMDRAKPPPTGAILFVGSSSIRLWKTLAQDFPRHRVINRGFGGSEMADSAHFADRIVLPYQPRMVVIYAGGNDINNGKSPEQVFEAFKELTGKIRTALPETTVACISIAGNPARWKQVEKVKAANALIAAYCAANPNMKFIDVFPSMLGSDNLPRPEIFVADQLHMNEEGYRIWTGIVRDYLPEPDVK